MSVPGVRILSREAVLDSIVRQWPDLQSDAVEWIDDGWDFLVLHLGPWAVRIARSASARCRLAREHALLDVLYDAPCMVPRYERVVPGMAVYPWIPGDAAPLANSPQDPFGADAADFIEWLHAQEAPKPQQDGRETWIRRTRQFCRRALTLSSPLLAPKEVQKLARRVDAGLAELSNADWRAVLLHGDLAREHMLVQGGRLSGVIDFGDWCWGDPAFDWCGIPGLRDSAPSVVARDSGLWSRVAFYQLLVPLHGIEFGFRQGHVQTVETQVRILRRLLLI